MISCSLLKFDGKDEMKRREAEEEEERRGEEVVREAKKGISSRPQILDP
jgi:hypothetical protein